MLVILRRDRINVWHVYCLHNELGEGFWGVLARIDHEYHKYDPDDTK